VNGYERLRYALDERGALVPSWSTTRTMAKCPAHNDRVASLSLTEGDDGKPLFYCFAGCEAGDILDALGLEWNNILPDLHSGHRRLVATYTYEDANGKPVARKLRYEPKGFSQEYWVHGAWAPKKPSGLVLPLYNVKRVVEAVQAGLPVYLLEGEKDVHTFEATQTGAVATTSGSWSGWLGVDVSPLKGARVIFVPDLDDAGSKAIDAATEALGSIVGSFEVRYPATGKDFTDHVFAGHGLDGLLTRRPVENRFMDWTTDDVEIEWLHGDVFAARTLVWCYGAKETAKSFYLLSVATDLTRRGKHVTFYSEEMSKPLDMRRIQRFNPDPRYFHWLNGIGLDLTNEDEVERVISENQGTSFIIFDSYERVWAGRANENRRAAEFAKVCSRIINETGATIAVIDHTGYDDKDAEGNDRPTRRARGASAKEQQADMSILFTSLGSWAGPGRDFHFRVENMKPGRLGNVFKRDLVLRDTEGGGLVVTSPYDFGDGAAEINDTTQNATQPQAVLTQLQQESTVRMPVPGQPKAYPLGRLTMRQKVTLHRVKDEEERKAMEAIMLALNQIGESKHAKA